VNKGGERRGERETFPIPTRRPNDISLIYGVSKGFGCLACLLFSELINNPSLPPKIPLAAGGVTFQGAEKEKFLLRPIKIIVY